MSRLFVGMLLVTATGAQTPGPGYADLAQAYEALRARDYDRAITGFERAVALEPARADIRKDLGYTLLKTGQSAAARDQFG